MKKVCIVGYGSIGKRHHKVLEKILNSATFDIVDINTELSVEECARKSYDILVICTPSNCHIDVLSMFEKVSDLVFVEKPLDSDFEKIENAYLTMSNKSLIGKVHVGCNLRFTNSFQKLSGIIQDTVLISVNSMSYLPSWRKRKNYKEDYSSNKSMGGGVVFDFIHEPDYIASLLGFPSSYKTIEKRLFKDITVDSGDTASILWEYDERIVNINLSYGSKKYYRNARCLLKNGDSLEITFNPSDIEQSYERQWRHILKNGPTNSFESSFKLLKILSNLD